MNKDKLKALKAIAKIIESSEDDLNHVSGLSHYSILSEIKKIEVSNEFGVQIKGNEVTDNFFHVLEFNRSYNINIGKFGSDFGRTISWSDDDRQPRKDGEWLYNISFPTGAYIFGESYPEQTFKSFFAELKSYNPKYIDSANRSLYFTKETAKSVHDNFNSIFEKYRGLVADELKANKIKKMKAELEKLEGES